MMILKFIFVLLAMVTATTARAVSLNMTSQCNRTLHGRTPLSHDYGIYTPNTMREYGKHKANTYTTQQIDQFQQAHNDVLMMCRKVIEESTCQTATFDRLFGEYFAPIDREIVLDVYKALLGYDGEGNGNPKFVDIDIVDDYPARPTFTNDHCTNDMLAVTVPKDFPFDHTKIILCPRFFTKSTFEGGEGREWPGVETMRCSNVGDRVTERMRTTGYLLLHEYTHIDALVQPPLSQHVIDETYGFYKARALGDKHMARSNADSYAVFAAELTWTLLCGRDFAALIEDDEIEDTPPTKDDPLTKAMGDMRLGGERG